MIAFLLALLFVSPMPRTARQASHDQVQTVCQVVEHPEVYDGKMITVEAFVVAGLHETVLQGEGCGRGIFMVHAAGNKKGKWPDFDSALARKSSGLDKSPLRVKVTGLYHAHVPFRSQTIRQLEVSEVLDITIGSPK